MNPESSPKQKEQDEIESQTGVWVNRTLLQQLAAEAGPNYPDAGFVNYDPETREGREHLLAYLERLVARYRPLEEGWERQHPGVQFKRRVPRIEAQLTDLRTQFPQEF